MTVGSSGFHGQHGHADSYHHGFSWHSSAPACIRGAANTQLLDMSLAAAPCSRDSPLCKLLQGRTERAPVPLGSWPQKHTKKEINISLGKATDGSDHIHNNGTLMVSNCKPHLLREKDTACVVFGFIYTLWPQNSSAQILCSHPAKAAQTPSHVLVLRPRVVLLLEAQRSTPHLTPCYIRTVTLEIVIIEKKKQPVLSFLVNYLFYGSYNKTTK